MSKKIYIVHSNSQYDYMYHQLGFEVTRDFPDADLVAFTGGSDVSPELYGEENVASGCNADRDRREALIYNDCLDLNIPMVGICRGAQFLNVMNGGRMWQDVDNHAIGGTHVAYDVPSGLYHKVTSTHHQMMRPAEGAELVATAALSHHKRAAVDRWDIGDSLDLDVEVVFYPKTRCLCFQPHPEYGVQSCYDYFKELLERYDLQA